MMMQLHNVPIYIMIVFVTCSYFYQLQPSFAFIVKHQQHHRHHHHANMMMRTTTTKSSMVPSLSSSSSSYKSLSLFFNKSRNAMDDKYIPTRRKSLQLRHALPSYLNNENERESSSTLFIDPLLKDISIRLHRLNWISWWCQVILTVISSITLLFARSVLNALVASGSGVGSTSGSKAVASYVPGGFLFAGSGIVLSYLSIIWTWGGTRLSRRIRRSNAKTNVDSNKNNSSNNKKAPISRIKAATMIRRTIAIGSTLNLIGMLVTLLGAEQIIGLLAAKTLTMNGISPFLSGGVGGNIGAVGLGTQNIQPLDIFIVQANTNTLLSHFLSLVGCLILTRSVHVLDPPSVEDDER